MPWDGRVSGWTMLKAKFLRDDPNYECVKSALFNATLSSAVGGALGFLATGNPKLGAGVGGTLTFLGVLVGSEVFCISRKLEEHNAEQ